MYGFRSCQAPVSQSSPALSGAKEMATSGGVPPLMPAEMSWSSLPRPMLTVIHGYFGSKS